MILKLRKASARHLILFTADYARGALRNPWVENRRHRQSELDEEVLQNSLQSRRILPVKASDFGRVDVKDTKERA